MSLDKIIIQYGADLKEVNAKLDELKRQMESVEKTAKDSSNKIKTDFKAAETGIQATTRATTQLGTAIHKTNAEFVAVSKSAQNVRKNIEDIDVKATKPLSESMSILGKRIAAAFAVGTLIAFSKQAVEVTAKMQGLNTQLNFITGSNEKGAESFAKLRLLVDRLGLELVSTTEAYTKFAGAATKSGLTLSQADDIFENVAIAAKAMNLTVEDTSGVFLALQQMISKGTVSAEELRGQLAERLPGAFSIAAKSIGTTEQGLGKMLEQGQVVSREFLPAFSQQLRETFEGAMGDATDSLTSNLNRMQNAWTEFKTSTGALLAPIVEGLAYTAIQIQNLFNDASVETIAESSAQLQKNIDLYKEFGDQIRAGASGITDAFSENLKKQNLKTAAEVRAYADEQIAMYERMAEGAADFRLEATRLGIEGINVIVNSMSELGKKTPLTTKEINALNEAIRKQKELINDNVLAVGSYVEQQQKLLALFVDFAIVETVNTDMQELNKQFSREQSETPIKTFGINTSTAADAILKAEDAAVKLKPALEGVNDELTQQEKINQAIDSWNMYADAVLSIFGSLNQAYQQGSDYRLSVLENELEQGLISEETFEKKRKEAMRSEAKREKAYSILSITLDTARAIMAALAVANPALATLAGITGAIQLGVVAAAPIPAFKTGVIDFNGKGTGTSDENLVRISNGESVITAKATEKHKPLLEAINKDKFEDFIGVYLQQKKVKQDVAVSWDDYRLLLELKKSTYVSKENTYQIVKAIKETKRPHRWM